MYQTIHEKINVVGVYKDAQFFPRKFLWRTQIYPVQEITMIADTKDGQVRKRYYSIVAKGNSYRLLFDRAEELWMLEEVWCE